MSSPDRIALDRRVREEWSLSWNDARERIRSGKVTVDGQVWTDPQEAVRPKQVLAFHPNAPRPRLVALRERRRDLVVHVDSHIVVVNKPEGVSTIPYDDEHAAAEFTLDAMVRELLMEMPGARGRRAELGVVHRLDKGTSGLLVFARTVAAKQHLSQQFRQKTTKRRYLALAHGKVEETTFRSYLVKDRGDGLRGSLRGKAAHRMEGQLAITHVEPLEYFPLPSDCTLIACRLETGRTHQIRIHLSESGHPLLGEPVYRRDFQGDWLKASRLMLHAEQLGFIHPATERPVAFDCEPPPAFVEALEHLRRRST